jgi:membrane associated rhomboid family serine protease
MGAADDPTLAAGVRWLAARRVTLGVVAVLLVVFLFQVFVLRTLGAASWQYLFLASGEPSPGWVMAPFSHRDLGHLLTTAVVVLVYGALLEGRLPVADYVAFYVAAGYASTVAQLGGFAGGTAGLGTLGASGAALGLVTLFTTTTLADRVRTGVRPTDVEVLFAATGTVIVALLLTNDFVPGVEFAAGTAPYGHAGGMLAGITYGLVRVRAQHRRDRRPPPPT